MAKLKAGLIGGGGDGAFFGRVHERVCSIDGSRGVVPGALPSGPASSLSAEEAGGVRGHGT